MTSPSEPNLRKLKPSRVLPQIGDVITYLMPDDVYRFGRVISTSAVVGPGMEGTVLLYLFRGTQDAPSMPPRATLDPKNLLIPPVMTNRLGWSRGYFETIANVPLETGDVLSQHCFYDLDGDLFDDTGAKLNRRSEPCGFRGLHSYRSLDDELSRTLGIPVVPD